MKIIDKYTELIISNYRATIVIIMLISIPLFYFFLHQRHYNDFNIYFEKNDPDLVAYRDFQSIYGNEQVVVVAFQKENLFTNENITLIRELTEAVKEIKGVQKVISLTDAEEPVTKGDEIKFRKIIPPGRLSDGELKDLRDKIINDETLVNRIISRDSTANLLLIEIKDLTKQDKTQMLNEIRKKTTEIDGKRAYLHFSGGGYGELEMNTLSKRDFAVFSPVVFLIIAMIIFLMLRNVRISLLCLSNLVLAIIWCVGFFVLCGETFNIVSIVMVPVILAISIADSVHILSHYKDRFIHSGEDHMAAVSKATRYVWVPCLFTSLTTAVGFFSFITGNVRPVKVVGIFTAIGVMMAFVLTVTFLPTMLVFGRKKISSSLDRIRDAEKEKALQETTSKKMFSVLLKAIGNFSTGNIKAICFVLLVLMIFSVVGIYNLTFETQMLKNLPEDNKFRMDTLFIEDKIGGVMPLVLLVKTEGDKDFTHPQCVKFLDTVEKDIMGDIKQFTSFSSITSFVKSMNEVFHDNKKEYYRVPENKDDIVEFYEMAKAEYLDSMLGPGYKEAKIIFSSVIDSSETATKISERIKSYLSKKTGGEYSYKMTGRVPLAIKMQENLRTSQINSFLMAFLIIFIMMAFVCRDPLLSVLSIIPNIFPIGLTLGLMGWFDLPITVGTVMIASITMGIAVDDTIHFIVSIKRNFSSSDNLKDVIKRSMMDVGKPIIITSVILFCGFFTLILGNILPTKTFGVLTALAMFFALIGDIIFLPALILFFNPRITPLSKEDIVE